MKHLLYYDQASKYVADQVACGGDGESVVSVVDGVAWCMNEEEVYFRYSGKEEDVVHYNVTIHYKSGDSTINPDETVVVDSYSGKSVSVCFSAKTVQDYAPQADSMTVVVSGDTEITFNYADSGLKILEYIETVSGYNVPGSMISTDFLVTTANTPFRVVSSFYFPKLDGTYYMMNSKQFRYNIYFQENTSESKVSCYRKKILTGTTTAATASIVEHHAMSEGTSADLTKGVNIMNIHYPSNAKGYGSFYKATFNIGANDEKNNYPYSSFDNVTSASSGVVRYYQNFETNGTYNDVTLSILYRGGDLAQIPDGSRFYGMKIYKISNNEVIYDLVPAKMESRYGIYEKISGQFFSADHLTGA